MRQAREVLRSRLGTRELRILVPLLVLAAGLWGFIELADEVFEGETRAFDEWAVEALREPGNPAQPIGPEWLAEASRDLTSLGSASVLALATVLVVGFLLLGGRWRQAIFVVVAVGGGLALSSSLKAYFDRPRPDIVARLDVGSDSFPSGHSLMSAVVFLSLGWLLTTVTVRRRLQTYLIAVALLLAGIVGVTRVYLGVHYPTDVLGGWTVGLVWALVCWSVARWLQRRGGGDRSGRSPSGAEDLHIDHDPGRCLAEEIEK